MTPFPSIYVYSLRWFAFPAGAAQKSLAGLQNFAACTANTIG